MNKTMVVVRFQVEGFHRWPKATPKRGYLAGRHRHMFHVEAQIELFRNDREIEFHDFLDFCKGHFPGGELHGKSCETMTNDLAETIKANWPRRRIEVSVFEDGEVGAIVSVDPDNTEVKLSTQ